MSMLLSKLVDQYVADRNRQRPVNAPLSAKTGEHLAGCVVVFCKFLCRPATVADLTAETLNAFLSHLFVNGKSDWTVKNRRTGLRVLWKYAHRRGLAGPFEDVQNVRVSALNVQGYDQRTITKLIEHTGTLQGPLRGTGLPKRLWWETFLLVLWETAVRSGDMLHIEPGHLDKAGWLWIVEHKTGKRGWRHLRQSVVERLLEFIAIDAEREQIWLGYNKRSLHRAFGRLVDDAGVSGSMRWIRRGAASEVERLNPGAGWRFLRHSVPTLFDKHYRVDKIVETSPIGPPELEPKMFRPKQQTKGGAA